MKRFKNPKAIRDYWKQRQREHREKQENNNTEELL